MEVVFWLALLALLLVLGTVIGRLVAVFLQRSAYAAYWRDQNSQSAPSNAFHLLVLGDSIMQGIGASRPMNGLAGLIARRIEQQLGRPVVITNLSVTGAKINDLVKRQLPAADFDAADMVVVSISANDSVRRTPIDAFSRDIELFFRALPAAKTIVADVPGVGSRNEYQPTLQRAAEAHHLHRAHLVEQFRKPANHRGVTAGDFFHPNDKGYRVWFAAFKPAVDRLLAERHKP